jgi:glyoxylase-like metal-dependent hydrolase (beta-lactamase superfamily II)
MHYFATMLLAELPWPAKFTEPDLGRYHARQGGRGHRQEHGRSRSSVLSVKGTAVTIESAGAPAVDVLLEGFGVNSSAGLAAFCAVVLIEGPDANGKLTRIIVDPAHVGRRTFLQDALARRGLVTSDIDMVVLTHAHWDHVQNIDVFDGAPVCLHPAERRYCQRPHTNDWATPSWTGAVLERMDIREISEGDELIPGVGVLALPGHTAGSIGVTVQNDQGLSVITGDALHYAAVAQSKTNPLIFWNADEAAASIDRAVAAADIIYPGHDQAFRLTGDGQIDYLRPFSLTITGVSRDKPGLEFDDSPQPPWVMPGIESQAELD